MGIFDRMGRVISSNVNSLLDKAEDPRKSLDLIVTQMTDQLREAKGEIIEGLGQEKVLAKKLTELDEEVSKWERRAELALKSDDEKLAREALKHKKRVIGERDRAEAMRAEQRGVVLNMKREMERMEQKLEELKARKGTIANEMERAKSGSSTAEGLGSKGAGGGAFAEFRRMEEKIEHKRAEAAAHAEVEDALHDGMSDMELESKFAALEGGRGPGGDVELDDEIARLKKKLRIG
ncbi:MAG: PspA/IM30 family protein [Deltaproteobacteria bacterium]|jgi:phage shock protein A|nr:PspA/IM30 family protein [Deltaproteobacteria bacterium]MBW2536296.1 PspA/IM30 family protein [Deltaproteobacteria bacterium]